MCAFNIGLGETYSVRQICQAAEEITRRRIPVRVGPRRAGDPAVLCASPRRIMQQLHWQPRHSAIREIIGSAWNWKIKHSRVAAALRSR